MVSINFAYEAISVIELHKMNLLSIQEANMLLIVSKYLDNNNSSDSGILFVKTFIYKKLKAKNYKEYFEKIQDYTLSKNTYEEIELRKFIDSFHLFMSNHKIADKINEIAKINNKITTSKIDFTKINLN